MAHRSARDALRERREEILGQLAALETVEDADQARTLLLRELDEVRSSLELITPPRPRRMRLRLVRGCDMRWENMVGDARVRHCGACDREVYDLTAMSADPSAITASACLWPISTCAHPGGASKTGRRGTIRR